MSSRVAVIVCTHLAARHSHLLAALESLDTQSRPADEVVVVVDGSPEGAQLLRDDGFERELLELHGQHGLAGARNAGVAACTSEIALFLDDDAIADTDWVARLSAAFDDPNVLGASGSSDPVWSGSEPRWLPKEFLWTVGCSYRGQPTTRSTVRNVYGGCCGLRRALFTDLGGYDERLGRGPNTKGGGEEAELCLRAHRRWPDGIFIHDPAARIQHFVPRERQTVRYLVLRAHDEGIMKAAVDGLHARALVPERDFAAQLPIAMAHHLLSAARGDLYGLARACLVPILALAVIAGLVRGRLAPLAPHSDVQDMPEAAGR